MDNKKWYEQGEIYKVNVPGVEDDIRPTLSSYEAAETKKWYEQAEIFMGKPEGAQLGTEKDLLNFIGGKEARNNYNAYYGNADNDQIIFTKMTLDEVLAWQDDFVAKGSPSSAVGNYQFIRNTLRDLKRTERLTGEELFDEALQDRLGTALLKRRGLDKYMNGDISAEQFANNLAKEWASLPVVSGPKAGQSYYAGDGLNKALTDVQPYMSVVAGLQDG